LKKNAKITSALGSPHQPPLAIFDCGDPRVVLTPTITNFFSALFYRWVDGLGPPFGG